MIGFFLSSKCPEHVRKRFGASGREIWYLRHVMCHVLYAVGAWGPWLLRPTMNLKYELLSLFLSRFLPLSLSLLFLSSSFVCPFAQKYPKIYKARRARRKLKRWKKSYKIPFWLQIHLSDIKLTKCSQNFAWNSLQHSYLVRLGLVYIPCQL